MNDLAPTAPIETRNGGIVLRIYDQDGVLREMVVPDTIMNRLFVVRCRKFDRAKGGEL